MNNHKEFVNQVFDSVSNKYDLMNDIMSIGMHRAWKLKFAKIVAKHANGQYLDLSTGSGDIVIQVIKQCRKLSLKPHITISDINIKMLEIAKAKLVNNNMIHLIDNIAVCDAAALDFDDNTFDLITLVFGLRNFHDIPKSINEIYRVLKPGGRLYCLDFLPPSNNNNSLFGRAYSMYIENVIPKMGNMIVGDEESYQYFANSIKNFMTKQELAASLSEACFQFVDYETWSLGICAMHVAIK